MSAASADPLLEGGAVRDLEPLVGQALARPGQPGGHGRRADQEQPGDVRRRDAEHQPQGERRRRLGSQRRVRAQQHQPQPRVAHHLAGIGHDALCLLLEVGLDGEQRQLAGRHRLGAQPVEDPAPGRGQQPGRRVGRYAVARPGPSGRLEGVAEPVLGEVEAPVLRDEQGQQAAPLVAPRPRSERRRRSARSLSSYPRSRDRSTSTT